jgi:hypothetical protein
MYNTRKSRNEARKHPFTPSPGSRSQVLEHGERSADFSLGPVSVKDILNFEIEQGISNRGSDGGTSKLDIPCSVFRGSKTNSNFSSLQV